jgi:hypothetical protein
MTQVVGNWEKRTDENVYRANKEEEIVRGTEYKSVELFVTSCKALFHNFMKVLRKITQNFDLESRSSDQDKNAGPSKHKIGSTKMAQSVEILTCVQGVNWFESRPEYMKVFLGFPWSPTTRTMVSQYLKLGHYRFLSHPFPFINHHHPIIWCCSL